MSALWVPIIVLSALGLLFGLVLGYTAQRFEVTENPVAKQIDGILPQSQCGQCGYPGCRPYAEAVVNGEMINKCVPGGESVMLKLADMLNIETQVLERDITAEPVRKVAYINEANCIGCTKCIQVCPVDAIVGAARTMHTVIIDFCTGCDLCVAPCPTNCIEMRPISKTPANLHWDIQSIPVQVIHVE